MTIFTLLAGVALALPLFAALLWSLAQAVRRRGGLRIAHASAGLLTLAAMAALSAEQPGAATATGGLLALAGLAAAVLETGWNRLLPLVQVAAGGALAAGLPFA
ncbi:MAG: hypothetical protein R6V44_01820 [Paracoccaceae bacterium]